MKTIAIVIPTLEPDERLPELIGRLFELMPENPVIIVNDGSTPACDPIFEELSRRPQVALLTHEVNRGKGRALKTAMAYYLENYPQGLGVITADGDGQHLPKDIKRCAERLAGGDNALVLGVRDFSGDDVPFKSRFGNELTKKVMNLVIGFPISDTQTGLRGIPTAFMPRLLKLKGERFEYETSMLLICRKSGFSLAEVAIDTVYMDANKGTHFHPVHDSVKIYWQMFKYGITEVTFFASSGLLSWGVDIGLFTALYRFLPAHGRLLWAVVIARVISATLNYMLNKNITFRSSKTKGSWWDVGSFARYAVLCAVILMASYSLTRWGLGKLPRDNTITATTVKTVVDIVLFASSFYLQKLVIFRGWRRTQA